MRKARRYPRMLTACLATCTLALGGCVARPGPPPVETNYTDPTTSSSQPARETEGPEAQASRRELIIAVDPMHNGFNPHLAADDTPFVQSLASLVLPSAFIDGKLNEQLLVDAQPIDPAPGAAQTVRYHIQPAAQWSDGTPITGADFRYLWQSITQAAGAREAALYNAVSDVRLTDSGKTVDVDLSQPISDWSRLFSHLLPSHIFLTGTAGFETVLGATIPVSGWKYQVTDVDQQRGEVVVQRNDRFWGASPVNVERLIFREVRGTDVLAEMLRRQQANFADVTPQETTRRSLSLVPGVQWTERVYPQRLDLTFSAHSDTLDTPVKRARFVSLLDLPLVASIAAGRSADLGLPAPSEYPNVQALIDAVPPDAEPLSPSRPVVIGVDAADDDAVAAARVIEDMAASHDIPVRVRVVTATSLYTDLMPHGHVDAVVSMQRSEDDPVELATRYSCDTALSGACDLDLDTTLQRYLAGTLDRATAVRAAADFEAQNVYSVPLLYVTRLEARGHGIIGPGGDISEWPVDLYAGRLSTAAEWRKSLA